MQRLSYQGASSDSSLYVRMCECAVVYHELLRHTVELNGCEEKTDEVDQIVQDSEV